MVKIEEVNFEGHPCVQLSNGQVKASITKDVGPRILELALLGGDNLFVVLPEARIPVQGQEDYSLRGGHRLWYAPEVPQITYLADDEPVEISVFDGGVEALQNVDGKTGIQKSIKVLMDDTQAMLTVDHKLENLGTNPFKLAPWAITMLRPGGVGLIPLKTDVDDENGLWPNRDLILWPYTDLDSPYFSLKNQAVSINAVVSEGALKVGASNPIGWLAYDLKGTLFTKKTTYQAGADYLDRGASSQIYCNSDLIELETLGPAVELMPGESVTHQEIWQIYPEKNWPKEIFARYSNI